VFRSVYLSTRRLLFDLNKVAGVSDGFINTVKPLQTLPELCRDSNLRDLLLILNLLVLRSVYMSFWHTLLWSTTLDGKGWTFHRDPDLLVSPTGLEARFSLQEIFLLEKVYWRANPVPEGHVLTAEELSNLPPQVCLPAFLSAPALRLIASDCPILCSCTPMVR